MYPVDTPQQLRTVLRALRQSRKLTQAELGERIGVSQKRIARIESAPELTQFDQIARIVSALGGRLVLEDGSAHHVQEPGAPYGDAPKW
jgi:HTH-type transcriptional regulator/antitoxin HipB